MKRRGDTENVGYVRFVVPSLDEESGLLQGVFQAVFSLRDEGQLEKHEDEWLLEDLRWLKMHLKSPACLEDPANRRAICWFHPSARRPIEKVRSIAALLEEKGISVRMLTTRDPGIVVYEDGWQVAAKPRRKRSRS